VSPAETLGAFVTTFLGQAVGYFAFVGLLFLLTRRWAAKRLAPRRIRPRGPRVDRAQLRHELGHSSVVLAIGAAQLLVIEALRARGGASLHAGLGPSGVAGAVAAFVGLMIFNDAWFYCVHRVLHTPWWFRRVHAVHHRSHDVSPLTAYSFHGVEALLVTGWVVPAAVVLPIPMTALVAAQVVGLLNNVMAHLGYELLPRWWVRAPLLRWTNTATFHSLHHQRYRGNFGLLTRVWDRLFGTELDGYERAFLEAHARADAEVPAGPPRGSDASTTKGR